MSWFITGGTGSFGTHYVRRLIDRGKLVTVYSRDELKQYEMAKEFPMVNYVIGDIRDLDRLKAAMEGHRHVIHAAALKHVRTGERHPTEAVQTNVEGTHNVAIAAKDAGVISAVLLSSDKAVMPVNTYGATKYLAEKVWLGQGSGNTSFTVTRYGNVIGSRGSVLHVFGQQKHGGRFTITDKRMTRFAVSFDYAMDLVDQAVYYDSGVILAAKVPSFRIVDLAHAFDPDAEIEETGIQAGEKLHEMMLTEYERSRARLAVRFYVVPQDMDGSIPHISEPYTSADGPHMTVEQIKEMIHEAI